MVLAPLPAPPIPEQDSKQQRQERGDDSWGSGMPHFSFYKLPICEVFLLFYSPLSYRIFLKSSLELLPLLNLLRVSYDGVQGLELEVSS